MYIKKIIIAFVVVTLIGGCSEFSKVKKGTDLDKKYDLAVKYFDKGDFVKSSMLLEELMTLYKGTARGENVYYYYAQCTFEQGDYSLAQYYFKNFVKTYPLSTRAEECAYMNARCYYLSSPVYSLDQSDTKSAIREFQLFINQYPQSNRIKECNELIDKLREKLEKKSYENVKQYYRIGDYKASVVAFNSTLKDFPDSRYREELMFLIVKSNYLLAINSIESKKPERLKTTIDAYFKFIDTFQKSIYLKEAESVYSDALKQQQKKI